MNYSDRSPKRSGRTDPRGFLLRVGIDSDYGGWNGPVDPETGDFVYVPIPEDARVVKDHPWLLEMAGGDAAEAGEPERARRAGRLARDLWSQLDGAEGFAPCRRHHGLSVRQSDNPRNSPGVACGGVWPCCASWNGEER